MEFPIFKALKVLLILFSQLTTMCFFIISYLVWEWWPCTFFNSLGLFLLAQLSSQLNRPNSRYCRCMQHSLEVGDDIARRPGEAIVAVSVCRNVRGRCDRAVLSLVLAQLLHNLGNDHWRHRMRRTCKPNRMIFIRFPYLGVYFKAKMIGGLMLNE